MNPGIPQRLWYPIKEAAHLLGMSAQFVYDDIRRSRRTDHPIPTRLLGNRLHVHRSYLFPEEPANVTHLPAPALTDAQLDAALDRAIARVVDRFVGSDARLRRSA